LHNQIARQQVGDDLPCADTKLLAPLKRSAEYRTIHPRLADIHPLDNWQQDGLHYFVFPLKAADGTLVSADDAPVAVFTMHPEAPQPVSVVVVTPSLNGGEAEVVDVRQPESSYTLPLPPSTVEAPASMNGQVNGATLATGETPSEDAAGAMGGDAMAIADNAASGIGDPPSEDTAVSRELPTELHPASPEVDGMHATTPFPSRPADAREPAVPKQEDEAAVGQGREDPVPPAGPADLHQPIASQQQVEDDLPGADTKLLGPLKRSPEYRTLHPRVADIRPIDNWQQDGLHYFVFQLRAADGAPVAPEAAPVAVFTMHPEAPEPISVVVVTPSQDGGEAEVVNLRQPESGYTVPLSPWDVPTHASLPEGPSNGVASAGGAPTADADGVASGVGETQSKARELAAG
jgi:hypothetical protein